MCILVPVYSVRSLVFEFRFRDEKHMFRLEPFIRIVFVIFNMQGPRIINIARILNTFAVIRLLLLILNTYSTAPTPAALPYSIITHRTCTYFTGLDYILKPNQQETTATREGEYNGQLFLSCLTPTRE